MIDRRTYQREVEQLLDQIRGKVRELRRLSVAGARGPALRDLEEEVARARMKLAYVVSGNHDDDLHLAA
jgi:hypothetical protein